MEYMRLSNGLEIAHVNASETALLYRRIFADGCYLRHGITVRPGDVVLDAGANIGMASLFFSQYCTDVAVYAFEPALLPFSALSENMKIYGIRGGCRQVALWESAGVRDFTYYPKATLMSGLYADVGADSALTKAFLRQSGFSDEDSDRIVLGRYEQQPFLAEVSTLAREIASFNIKKIDLLKLDVEKSELHVLRGMKSSDWPRVRQVVAEVHDINGRLSDFTDLLGAQGFDVSAEQEELLKGTEIYTVYAVRPR
jgi:31-O-methyltransferase